MARKLKEKALEPISAEEREGWDNLIAETTKVVNKGDSASWELILLAGKVEKSYGDNRIARWADEAGISLTLARQYAWLSRKGITKAFITKWARTDRKPDGLSYSVIREIAGFHGGLTSPYALEALEWAVKHKATVKAVRGFHNESIAPQNHMQEASESWRVALRDKQQHEGFSDFVLEKLEEILEEHPEAESELLRTVITSAEDLSELKVAAGVAEREELDAVSEARKHIRKIKSMYSWMREHKDELSKSIAANHEASPELQAVAKMLESVTSEVAKVVPVNFDGSKVKDVEMELRNPPKEEESFIPAGKSQPVHKTQKRAAKQA